MKLPPFRNEPYADFQLPVHRAAMEQALAQARGELGREYPIIVKGERLTTQDKIPKCPALSIFPLYFLFAEELAGRQDPSRPVRREPRRRLAQP